MYRIEIDLSLCSGFGVCAELAPDVVAVGPDGLAALRTGATDNPAVLEAAESCPMAAITVALEEAA
jgi:ferredoxin